MHTSGCGRSRRERVAASRYDMPPTTRVDDSPMTATAGFAAFAVELLGAAGRVAARRMFGGDGLYCEGGEGKARDAEGEACDARDEASDA
jgi:hypothetical protein